MKGVEAFLMGALILIGIFLVLNAARTSQVVDSVAKGLSGVFKTLQGQG